MLDGDDYAAVFAALPTPYLVMDRDLVVAAANDAFLVVTGRSRTDLVGRAVFEAFPPTEEARDASGRVRVQVALERVRDTGVAEVLPVQQYAIEDLEGGVTSHHWSLIGVPLPDERGRTRLVVLRAEDVSDVVAVRDRGLLAVAEGDEWRRRAEEVEADLFARAEQLAAAVEGKQVAAQRLASLADVALELTSVETLEELEEVVVGRGLSVLGADGGAVTSLDDDGTWRITVNSALGEQVQLIYGHVPYDSPLPACWTARTGERLLLPTRETGLAFCAGMAEVYADTRRHGWAFLPLQVRGERLGALAVSWVDERDVTDDELEVLDGFAAQCAQALDRIRTTAAQRAATVQVERMSEALQLSLLTRPPTAPDLQIAARYLPAMSQARVGGDWYDAFVDTSGATLLSVGDVTGHDRNAAAAMAQVRNVLRGLAVDSHDSPGLLLTRLDRALATLDLDVLATALLARIEPGSGLLRWSSAGHLPPVMCLPDGRVQVLSDSSDLLLGLDATTERTERLTHLPSGSTLVLCTDGLVERRDEHLDDGLQRLAEALRTACGHDVDDVCSTLLKELLDEEPEDDVALLVVRVL